MAPLHNLRGLATGIAGLPAAFWLLWGGGPLDQFCRVLVTAFAIIALPVAAAISCELAVLVRNVRPWLRRRNSNMKRGDG